MKIINQLGFSPILLIVIFLLLLVSIPLGAFYIKSKVQTNPQSTSTNTPFPSPESSESMEIAANPEDIVKNLFEAIKENNKDKVKSYLSPNVNKAPFKSTFEETNAPSLYNQEFSYKITKTETNLEGNTAFVNLEVNVAGQTLPTMMTLEKNASGVWLVNNSETVTYGNVSLPFQQLSDGKVTLKRVLLLLNGPAELYITSPEGIHTGFDPNLKKQVNEIKDVSYSAASELKSMAITDLTGAWELKVIGTGNGKYSFGAEIVGQMSQPSVTEGVTTPGSIENFIIRYPSESGKPLEIVKIK